MPPPGCLQQVLVAANKSALFLQVPGVVGALHGTPPPPAPVSGVFIMGGSRGPLTPMVLQGLSLGCPLWGCFAFLRFAGQVCAGV